MTTSKIKTELHVHTESSFDSRTTYTEVVKFLKTGKIDKLGITDHGTIAMAKHLKEDFPSQIIVGEEVLTTGGEIIGLFLTKEIPSLLPPLKTIELIKEQGGVVYIPHPFDKRRKGIYQSKEIKEIIKQADVIEIFNARVWRELYNHQAYEMAGESQKLFAVGSDAHTIKACGSAYQIMPDFKNKEDFLRGLSQAELVSKRSSLLYLVNPTINKIVKRLF